MRRPGCVILVWLIAAAAATCVALPGCIVVPTSFDARQDDLGHRSIDAAAIRRLEPGVTTAAECEGALGAPTLRLAAGRLLVYSWTTRQRLQFFWLAMISGAGAHTGAVGGEQIHYLALEFAAEEGDAAILQRKRVAHDVLINASATGVDDVFRR